MRCVSAFLPLLALLLTPATVWGNETPSQSRAQSSKQEHLRRCVAMEIENDGHKERLEIAEQQMDFARRAVRDQGSQIDRGRRALDLTDGAAVDAFNEKVDHHDILRAELDEKIDAFNALVEAFNPAVERFNLDCAGVPHPWEERYAEKQRQLKRRGAE